MKYLDYIESAGNCWFDTGIKASSRIRIMFKVRISASTGLTFIGQTFNGDNASFRFFAYQWHFYLDYGNGLSLRLNGGSVNASTDYELEIGNRYLKYIDGDYILNGSAASFDYSSYDTNINLLGQSEQGRIYYCKIYEDDELVRDFVSVMEEDGRIGLFDKVSNTFFGNLGTGNLTYGEIISFDTTKYLIGDDSGYYTLIDDNLQSIDIETLTADVFETYGFDTVPQGVILGNLTDPKIYCWTDAEAPKTISAHISALPFPQTISTEKMDLTDDSIKGISDIECEYEGAPLIQMSFDEGMSWEYYSDGAWTEAEDISIGMTPDVLASISDDAWTEKIDGVMCIYLRITLSSTADRLTKIKINFVN